VIDYWVIMDTGSTDGTQEIIRNYLKDIPGELHERPWKNFGYNRSEAFTLTKGKGDYILFMDADDTLEYAPDFATQPLTDDLYNMWRGTSDFNYLKPQLARGNLPWKWVGVTHEYLACDEPFTASTLTNVKYVTGDGGACALDPKKFIKNVKLLREGLKEEPDNARYVFYLAESYRDAGQKGKAIEYYQKRVAMGGWDEEVFWAFFQIGNLLRDIGLASEIVAEAYKRAHRYRPHRVEPVYCLAELYNQQGEHRKAYECIKEYEALPKPPERDFLFNMTWMEEYGLRFQLSICSYFVGRYRESLDACDKLLACKNLPEGWVAQTKLNRTFPLEKLKKK
jgi:glycosyltransferase involved in cell wall biosynthesis